MKKIIEELKELKANIDSDIKQVHHWNFTDKDETLSKWTLQSTQIAMAIGILENIGKNPNIEE
jgi:hypothetical protein